MLLLGGREKRLPFETLAAEARQRARAVICFGEAAAVFAHQLKDAWQGDSEAPRVEVVDDLAAAVAAARAGAVEGDVVLLSPAGTSFDAYENFTVRGDHFASLATDRSSAVARANLLNPPTVGRLAFQTGERHGGAPDWPLIAAIVTLTLIGLIFVFSSSFAVGQQLFGDPQHFAMRQLLGAGIGAIAFSFFAYFDYRRLRFWSPIVMAAAVLLLLAVITPGVGFEQNGARRWIQIGSAPPVQPSEVAKLAIVIYVAAWLTSRGVTRSVTSRSA